MDHNDTMNFNDLAARVETVYDNNHEYLDTALNRAVADIASAVKSYNKQGEISVTIKIKPVNDRAVMVTADLKAKGPRPSAAAATLYINNRGRLVADDPRQDKLPGMSVVNLNK